jgi:hypothetical protein
MSKSSLVRQLARRSFTKTHLHHALSTDTPRFPRRSKIIQAPWPRAMSAKSTNHFFAPIPAIDIVLCRVGQDESQSATFFAMQQYRMLADPTNFIQ